MKGCWALTRRRKVNSLGEEIQQIREAFQVYYMRIYRLTEFVHDSGVADSLFLAFVDASLRTVKDESQGLLEAIEGAWPY